MKNDRYEGRPLVRLLECYVLKAIGMLSFSDNESLISMGPKLSEIYGKSGAWDKIIEMEMGFPDNMPALILDVWNKNKKIAENNGVEIDPQVFSEMFVDENFL